MAKVFELKFTCHSKLRKLQRFEQSFGLCGKQLSWVSHAWRLLGRSCSDPDLLIWNLPWTCFPDQLVAWNKQPAIAQVSCEFWERASSASSWNQLFPVTNQMSVHHTNMQSFYTTISPKSELAIAFPTRLHGSCRPSRWPRVQRPCGSTLATKRPWLLKSSQTNNATSSNNNTIW